MQFFILYLVFKPNVGDMFNLLSISPEVEAV